MKISPLPDDTAILQGDFGARVEQDTLLVPKRLFDRLNDEQIRTAEDFLSYLQVSPGSLAYLLKWTTPDIETARKHLEETLKPFLAPGLFVKHGFSPPPVGVTPKKFPNK